MTTALTAPPTPSGSVPFPVQPGPRAPRRSVVLLHAPQGGPGPRERRATAEATAGWSWSCAVVHDGSIDPVRDACLLEQLRHADLVVCADDSLRAAVLGHGIDAAVLTGSWPGPERWATLLDDLYVVVSS